MVNEEGFNGFANYETWCVCLWMNNDADRYSYYRGLAQVSRNESKDSCKPYFTREETERIVLAQTLKDEFAANSPLCDSCTVYADLMHAALKEVDWYELATELLSNIEEDS